MEYADLFKNIKIWVCLIAKATLIGLRHLTYKFALPVSNLGKIVNGAIMPACNFAR